MQDDAARTPTSPYPRAITSTRGTITAAAVGAEAPGALWHSRIGRSTAEMDEWRALAMGSVFTDIFRRAFTIALLMETGASLSVKLMLPKSSRVSSGRRVFSDVQRWSAGEELRAETRWRAERCRVLKLAHELESGLVEPLSAPAPIS